MTIFGSINLLGKSEPSLRVHAIRQTQTAGAAIGFLGHEAGDRRKRQDPKGEGGAATGHRIGAALNPLILVLLQQSFSTTNLRAKSRISASSTRTKTLKALLPATSSRCSRSNTRHLSVPLRYGVLNDFLVPQFVSFWARVSAAV